MENERHLRDSEFAEIANGGEQETAHLAACAKCRADLDAFTALTSALRDDLGRTALRSEIAWSRQRAGIRERIVGSRPALRWAIAGMSAVMALSLGLITFQHHESQRAVQTQQGADDDDALLKGIQHTLAQRAPEPLMPASVLVQEMTTESNHEQKRND